MRFLSYVVCVLCALHGWGFVGALQGAVGLPGNKSCLECHSDKTLTMTNAVGKEVSAYVDESRLLASVHRTNLCSSCHSDLKSTHPDDNVKALPVYCSQCHGRQSETNNASVHGMAILSGKKDAANCADCHGSHNVLKTSSPESPLHYTRITETCGECHPAAAKDVKESVHGKSVAAGHREAATCLDCHDEHRLQAAAGMDGRKVSGEVCAKCHASERINTKFKMPSNRIKTFFDSYHGLASQYGSARAANCASCHGVHNILPSTDSRSTINKAHLVETCGKCHAGATEKFAVGEVHVDLTTQGDIGGRVNRWIRTIYITLIVLVIGGMLVHNFLDWGQKALATLRSKDRTVQRMTQNQRRQHAVLVTSFVLLAITGFALKFPDSWIAWVLGSDENVRRFLHRGAGLVLVALSVYHVFYLKFCAEGRQLLSDLMPKKDDIEETHQSLLHIVGKRAKFKRPSRFGYVEKSEYWAMAWGTAIMGATGFLIWFKIDVTQFVPRWVVDAGLTVHYYEAILACLAVVVWHFYHILFAPESYPMNWAWWDGKAAAHELGEEIEPESTPAASQAQEAAAVKTVAKDDKKA